MLGDWLRAGGIFLVAALLDSVIHLVGEKLLGIADASAAPVDTQIVTYGQYAIDWWLEAVGISLLILLIFRAWKENRVTEYR